MDGSMQGANQRCNLPFLRTVPTQLTPRKRVRNAAGFNNFVRFSGAAEISLSVNWLASQSNVPRPESIESTVNGIAKAFKALQKPAAVLILLAVLLIFHPQSALAASGGRMGGRSFSSSKSISSSPSSSSLTGNSAQTINPNIPYQENFYAPSPYRGGSGMGAAGWLMISFMMFMFVWGLVSGRSGRGVLTATEKTCVLKLQVGLFDTGRSVQREINRIAETADTSSSKGLSYVLTESTLALLRHPEYCISGYSSVDVKKDVVEGEECFNKLSVEERGKFDEETLVNVNNTRKQSPSCQRTDGFNNEYMVVTMLVAAEGVQKLPGINSSGDLEKALQMLGSIPSSRVLAVEVLWTPQSEGDTLSKKQLLEDYPILRPLLKSVEGIKVCCNKNE